MKGTLTYQLLVLVFRECHLFFYFKVVHQFIIMLHGDMTRRLHDHRVAIVKLFIIMLPEDVTRVLHDHRIGIFKLFKS